jgi:transposase
MIVCGVDCHKEWSQLCVLDTETGEVFNGHRVPHTSEALQAAFTELPRPQILALEAGRNSYFLHTLYQSFAEQVWVVDPHAVKRLCGRRSAKTDKRDAHDIARLVAGGQLEPLYVPDERTMQRRALTRAKKRLTNMATQLRNQIRGLLALQGLQCPWRDLLGQGGRAYLQGLELPGPMAAILVALLEALLALQRQAEALKQLVDQEAMRDPQARLLRSIPGVGSFLSLSLSAEIGDVRRFADACTLRGYSGLVPRIDETGGRRHTGPLTKLGNPHLRYAAVMAAQIATNQRTKNDSFCTYARRQRYRLGPNPGKCATARRLLTMAFHMLHRREPFRG